MEKVLILAHNFPPAIDGGSQLLFNIASHLQKEGYEILVLASDAYSSDDYINSQIKRIKAGWSKESGLSVFRIKTFRFFPKIIKKLFLGGPIFINLPIFAVKKWKPDVVIGGVFPTTIPLYAKFFSLLTGSRLVLLPCLHTKDQSFHKKSLFWVLKKSDTIWALTKEEKKFYQNELKIEENKIKVIKPVVDKSLLLKRKAGFSSLPSVMFLGNQAAHKRIEMLIDAFVKVLNKFPKAKLFIVGKRTLYSAIIDKKINSLPTKTRSRIETINKCSDKRKIKLIDQVWAIVNPSLHESLGLVFLESWARKKPVIAANLTALEQVISNGKDGFLFNKSRVGDLEKKIIKLFKDKEMAVKMGEKGYHKVVDQYVNRNTGFGPNL